MKQRILMLIHQFRPITNGTELQAERLAYGLAGRGYPIKILTPLLDPSSRRHEDLNGVSVHRTKFSLSYSTCFHISRQFKYLVKNRNSYDVIHSHQCFNHAVVAAVVAKWFGKKTVLKIACAGDVGDLTVLSRFSWFCHALKILRQTDAVIAISSAIEKELLGYGFPADRIQRIPNGVDTVLFKRDKPFPDRSKVVFVLVGRRTPQKGIDISLKAVKLLIESGISEERIELRLYGLDYKEYDYRAMAAVLDILPIVKFYPPTDNIMDVYRSTHCLILPSRAEGLSNVLLEAMSFEIPVIATSISGTVDVIEHGKS
ncbi:MAG TPA: glycosyltransferase family 4 protein, partial [Thermodesulfovibrionia bacterium]|nr:glycosyltransferase family 4 protein [Thermodesulfovibrionia bacterium]